MVEKQIKDHQKHTKELLARAMTNKADSIKELIDYLVLSHSSGHSELILERGIALVQQHPAFVQGSNFYIVEECFFASCELQQLEWARFFLQMIRLEFPESIKVMRLLAVYHEAKGEMDKAQNILVDLVEQNPLDKQSTKRLVALYRDMHLHGEAIALLNKYTELNQTDQESWQELADMYHAQQNYAKAIHCYEEILMRSPKNYHVALKYAELLYSSRRDRFEDVSNARKYFMLAAMTKGTEGVAPVRALFGIIKSTKAIQQLQTRGHDENAVEIVTSAQEQLREVYGRGCAKAQTALERMPLMQPFVQANQD